MNQEGKIFKVSTMGNKHLKMLTVLTLNGFPTSIEENAKKHIEKMFLLECMRKENVITIL